MIRAHAGGRVAGELLPDIGVDAGVLHSADQAVLAVGSLERKSVAEPFLHRDLQRIVAVVADVGRVIDGIEALKRLHDQRVHGVAAGQRSGVGGGDRTEEVIAGVGRIDIGRIESGSRRNGIQIELDRLVALQVADVSDVDHHLERNLALHRKTVVVDRLRMAGGRIACRNRCRRRDPRHAGTAAQSRETGLQIIDVLGEAVVEVGDGIADQVAVVRPAETAADHHLGIEARATRQSRRAAQP